MKLTAYTDYTLRTLIYLAINRERRVTIADIARTYRVSEAHLTKIVHQLGAAGDIATMRGKGGGVWLNRPPEHINLGAVVRRTEPDLALVACFEDGNTCAIAPACVLQTVLRDALAGFLAVLDSTTLADLVAPRHRLAALLGIVAATA